MNNPPMGKCPVIAALRDAQDLLKEEENSRIKSIIMTKLDEAILWRVEHISGAKNLD